MTASDVILNPRSSTERNSESFGVVARKRLFSSAHFYAQPKMTKQENQNHFGRCFTPHGHGHNYVLEVFIQGPIDTNTRMVMNLADLDRLLQEVVDPLDHQHLNFDLDAFKGKIPTTEVIATYLRDQIRDKLSREDQLCRLNRLRLSETDDIWVEIFG